MGPSETHLADAYPQAPASPSFPSPPRPRCAPASPRVFRDRVKAEGKVRPARRAVSPARRSPPPLERALAEDRLSNSEATILKQLRITSGNGQPQYSVCGVWCSGLGARESRQTGIRDLKFSLGGPEPRIPNPGPRRCPLAPSLRAPNPDAVAWSSQFTARLPNFQFRISSFELQTQPQIMGRQRPRLQSSA